MGPRYSLCLMLAACAKATSVAPITGDDASIDIDAPHQIDAADIDAPIDAMIDAPKMIDAAISVTLTETNSTNAMSNSVTCPASDGQSTAENSWYRVFTLADFGVTDAFHVTQVTFGGQESSGTQTIQVKVGIYTGTTGGTTLDLTKVTPLNSTNVTVNALTDPGQQIPAPITADIPAGGSVIVEVFSPDHNGSGGTYFYIGASNAGETKPGYVRAPTCVDANSNNITVPTSTAAIGVPQANININVTGLH